jgi:predicted RNase H-like HicB family nuclease
MTRSVVVKAARDSEAGVWYVEQSDLFGLNAEAETLEELVKKLPAVISDLLEPGESEGAEVPIELVVHVTTSVQLHSDAA